MAINFLKYPNKLLDVRATNIDKLNSKVKKSMAETMKFCAENVLEGIDGNSIGLGLNFFALYNGDTCSKEIKASDYKIYINPLVIDHSKDETKLSCGSPLMSDKFQVEVYRFDDVTITYTDLEGNEHTEIMSDENSSIIQHFCDSLRGITLVDRCVIQGNMSLPIKVVVRAWEKMYQVKEESQEVSTDG